MITGTNHPLLDHATGCDGREFAKCSPVPLVGRATAGDPELDEVAIIYMEWCGECGAADYELVGTL